MVVNVIETAGLKKIRHNRQIKGRKRPSIKRKRHFCLLPTSIHHFGQ